MLFCGRIRQRFTLMSRKMFQSNSCCQLSRIQSSWLSRYFSRRNHLQKIPPLCFESRFQLKSLKLFKSFNLELLIQSHSNHVMQWVISYSSSKASSRQRFQSAVQVPLSQRVRLSLQANEPLQNQHSLGTRGLRAIHYPNTMKRKLGK